VDPRVVRDRWNVDPDQARIPVGQKSIDERKGSRVGAAHRRSSQRTFGSLDRRAHQTMGERQMNEGFEQFLATIIEQCLDEHDIQAPLVVRTVGNNGSVLVVGIQRRCGACRIDQTRRERHVHTADESHDRQPRPHDRAPRHRARRQYRPVPLIIEVGRYLEARLGPLVWLTPPNDPAAERSGPVRPTTVPPFSP
jgi:hypothetical protein